MKLLFNLIFLLLSAVFIVYVALPTPTFPDSLPPGSLQSDEKGDTENFANRRAYFTDQTRAGVLDFHQSELSKVTFMGYDIKLPTYRLNYRPEDAVIYIKELTRSWYLEEIVHPFRESFFVNGFIPQVAKDAIVINGREFEQKITVRYYRSELFVRLALALASLSFLYILIREWYRTLFLTRND